MTKTARRFLLTSLIIVFLLIAPAVLFYAWGYSFDWQNKKPVLTGGIYLESIPKKAEIYVNDELKARTPKLVKRLLPREYQIKLVKKDHHPWQKKMRVESKLVTEARNIFLVPQKPALELIRNDAGNNFSLEEFLKTDGERKIIIKAEKILSGLNTGTTSLDQIVSYKVIDQDIFYLQKPSYILYQTDLSGAVKNQVSLSPLPENNYQIFISPDRNLAVLDNKDRLYFLNQENKNFENLAENIKEVQFSKDGKKLLYFSKSEIWVYYLKENLIQPFKKAGEKELITRLSQEIKQAIWYPETNEHIIFSVGSLVKITELDGRDIRNTVDFLEKETSQIAYDQETESLYFTEGEKLYSVSLE
ncbi:MAG: hypothetical protein A3A94_00805 [Candidatus Portnoybacteria bacterium RIFCSPLOWO2_01_FULL_43_11]|nr:MAG: hypothetical protein A3D38_00270 [Candidatus Portnoybacteria bacterium RIFCSPHIGHO2_02_FULL_40_23]OGZ38569.1 MAG: hypothetical protein A3A94_00805 [Candidatus Portnoybacteria bacterium RIFCSPLOWO2_01_FULL_43_11]